MGNCLKSNRVMAYSPAAKKVERVPATGSAMARSEKAVRFELSGGDDGGVARIKVVMTRNELKRILKDGKNDDSGRLKKLIGELMVKGRIGMVVSDARIEEAEDENGRWTPPLESIPEHLY